MYYRSEDGLGMNFQEIHKGLGFDQNGAVCAKCTLLTPWNDGITEQIKVKQQCLLCMKETDQL